MRFLVSWFLGFVMFARCVGVRLFYKWFLSRSYVLGIVSRMGDVLCGFDVMMGIIGYG